MPNLYVDKFIIEEQTILVRDAEAHDILYKPNYIMIADSYANDINRDGKFVTGWTTRLKTALGLTEGTNCFTAFDGGSGFVRAGGQGYSFLNMLENITNNLTAQQKSEVGTIIMAGGSNDFRYEPNADYNYAMNQIYTYVQANYPDAKVFIVPIGMSDETRGRRRVMPVVYQKIQDACSSFKNFVYVHGAWFPLYLRTNMCTDGVHPTNNGQVQIVNAIRNGLNSINNHYFQRADLKITLSSDFTSTIDPIEAQLSDNLIYFQFAKMNFNLQKAASTDWRMDSSAKAIGTYTCDLLYETCNFRMPITGRVRAGGPYYEFVGYLQFKEGTVSIVTTSTGNTSGFPTVKADRIYIDIQNGFMPIENI